MQFTISVRLKWLLINLASLTGCLLLLIGEKGEDKLDVWGFFVACLAFCLVVGLVVQVVTYAAKEIEQEEEDEQ